MNAAQQNADPVYVIAEAGVNHTGELGLALALIDVAADTGADAVKFQTFRAAEMATTDAPKAEYQKSTTEGSETQFEMLRRLELGEDAHRLLLDHALARGLDFLSTPFDIASLRFLTGELGLKTLKIASGEITNGPLLLAAARSGSDIILSTGMSTLGEVEEALAVLAFGFTTETALPSRTAFAAAFASDEGRQAVHGKLALLHCTSEYPAPFEDVNLAAMATLAETFGVRVGLSDHTRGIAAAVAATALGAGIVEKHFTLDRALPGPDHSASLDPHQLADMIAAIRDIEKARGDGIKAPAPSECRNREIVRKSLVALCPIAAGESFSEENLGCKRPGDGVSPMDFWHWLGRPADRAYAPGEKVSD